MLIVLDRRAAFLQFPSWRVNLSPCSFLCLEKIDHQPLETQSVSHYINLMLKVIQLQSTKGSLKRFSIFQQNDFFFYSQLALLPAQLPLNFTETVCTLCRIRGAVTTKTTWLVFNWTLVFGGRKKVLTWDLWGKTHFQKTSVYSSASTLLGDVPLIG